MRLAALILIAAAVSFRLTRRQAVPRTLQQLARWQPTDPYVH